MPRRKHPERAMVTVLGVRLTAKASARLDAMVARVPNTTRHRVAREALLRGLSELEGGVSSVGPDPTPAVRHLVGRVRALCVLALADDDEMGKPAQQALRAAYRAWYSTD